MRIGFGLPVSGSWATPERLGRVAVAAEREGYDSLWSFQRLYVGAEQELDPFYRSVLDPLVALGYAAALTETIRLGVAVVNLPFVSPTYLAKQAATLDVLSGGRVDLGLGTGWSEAEFTAAGASAERRAARTREFVAVLRTLWRDEVSEFAGEFFTVPPGRMLPRPVQQDGVQILLGGSVPAALRRAGEIADGWVSRSAHDLTQISRDVELVREGAEKAGRDPDGVRIVCRGALFRPGRGFLDGSWEKIREDVAWLGTQGVTEVFYDLNFDPSIAAPEVDADAAEERALDILHNLTPRGLS
ncbi:LLM class flavin-dependent oxidoreductase [Dactylosporangium matsuzakiense]|uniref:LLM class F420-dependent oxidoreductase n=1 Tax=Dactylosporangium matsuzakiense TaxID=53360 RepID=A0A9W6KHA0_9ACTN|nr:TIGR03619 family F420-dependent LLM class oxidoreductase [Dactylosporangium matsuzakiense]UWZ46372.1 LLM class flavin-dependent oxidoreductase [Dactylosporangium matsuzakiense]GLL02086.1 LLM class F420-dependent oxidoreductase [Dactylosporangium matsuzakiense]